MASKLLLFLFLFALGETQADYECSIQVIEEKIRHCFENFVTMLSDRPSDVEICRKVEAPINCLIEITNECLNDEEKPELDPYIQSLISKYNENCGYILAENCVQENNEFIMQCLVEDKLKVIAHLEARLDVAVYKCTWYNLIVQCITERTEDKCPEKGNDYMSEKLEGTLQKIKQLCDKQNSSYGIEFINFESLFEKKKK
ncbi:uncharacterized protein [Parasteatoda tepidariorum]|uniref:uncharacterized protein n=1 Tax=Parasteatoda tepidariorum TaxID=114398 RepID=UPI00077FDAA7|nr:uncharacterized protein LOC107444842 [Parasteatoda tepidariorum]